MFRSPTTHHIGLAGGRTLAARTWPGQGMPIVFLHGMLSSSDVWSGACSGLSRPCIAFDLPGFGGSDLPVRAGVDAYAGDVAAGIRALGLERFELVGHSFGGAVAARVAELLADRVTSLLLLAPAGFGRNAVAEAASLPGLRSLAARRLGLAGREAVAASSALRALVGAGRSRRLSSFAGPVTTLWGTEDKVVRPAHAAAVSAVFAGAQIVVWDGMGHHPQSERPDQLAELVSNPHGRSDRRAGAIRRGRHARSARAPRRSWRPGSAARRLLWPLPRVQPTPRFA